MSSKYSLGEQGTYREPKSVCIKAVLLTATLAAENLASDISHMCSTRRKERLLPASMIDRLETARASLCRGYTLLY